MHDERLIIYLSLFSDQVENQNETADISSYFITTLLMLLYPQQSGTDFIIE